VASAEDKVIAIVDDDHAVRDSVQLLLEVAGHRVEVFASATEFLKDDIQRFAGILLDNYMPVITGLDLAARLRANGSAVPIMLMTGSPTPAIHARAAQLGIDRVFEKPLATEHLLAFAEAVRNI